MLSFIIGTVFGGLFGVVTMCLCQISSESDKKMNEGQ